MVHYEEGSFQGAITEHGARNKYLVHFEADDTSEWLSVPHASIDILQVPVSAPRPESSALKTGDDTSHNLALNSPGIAPRLRAPLRAFIHFLIHPRYLNLLI